MSTPAPGTINHYTLGIIGHPLGHTLSPLLHHTLLERLDLAGSYTPLPIAPEAFDEAFPALLASGQYTGLNVTIPYKTRVILFLSELTETARAVGAVNTLYQLPNGSYGGDNTDVEGFWMGVPSAHKLRVPGGTAILLGVGGSALAVSAALIDHGIGTLYWVARDPAKGENMRTRMAKYAEARGKKPTLIAVPWSALSTQLPWSEASLVVQTTPMGMTPNTDCPLEHGIFTQFHPEALLYDLVYRPMETPFLAQGKAVGLDTQNGLAMLVGQGIRSFERWTGLSLPAARPLPWLDDMMAVLTKALEASPSP